MMEEKLYIGMDIGKNHVLVSCFTEGNGEPETLSTIAGSEQYQIPMALYKKRGIGQWYFGREAFERQNADAGGGTLIQDLWEQAKAGSVIRIEDVDYRAMDLLAVFFRKVLMLPRRYKGQMKIHLLGLTVEDLDAEKVKMLKEIMKKLGIQKEQFFMMDHSESFYYYALSQKKELWLHDVVLFSGENDRLWSCVLSRNENTTPQIVTLLKKEYGRLSGDRDLEFSEYIKEVFQGRIISCSYLVGDGFEGDWMKQSVRMLCSGRRAFFGKNLYTKGVCYAAGVRDGYFHWPFVYIGEHELKYNVSIKVRTGEGISFYSLLSAGESCFEAEKECEVILDDAPRVDFWLQYPESGEAKVETLELTDLPECPAKTTRLRITLKPLSDQKIQVSIKDLGFGEIRKSSDKVFLYTLKM